HLPHLADIELPAPLARHDYAAAAVPVIRGNALAALHSGGADDAACRCIDELTDALDRYVPIPERPVDQPFLMSVENVFQIEGRGTVATGKVERGRLRPGGEVEIVGLRREPRRTVAVSIERFREIVEEAEAGDNIGVLLRGVL